MIINRTNSAKVSFSGSAFSFAPSYRKAALVNVFQLMHLLSYSVQVTLFLLYFRLQHCIYCIIISELKFFTVWLTFLYISPSFLSYFIFYFTSLLFFNPLHSYTFQNLPLCSLLRYPRNLPQHL